MINTDQVVKLIVKNSMMFLVVKSDLPQPGRSSAAGPGRYFDFLVWWWNLLSWDWTESWSWAHWFGCDAFLCYRGKPLLINLIEGLCY